MKKLLKLHHEVTVINNSEYKKRLYFGALRRAITTNYRIIEMHLAVTKEIIKLLILNAKLLEFSDTKKNYCLLRLKETNFIIN